MRNLLLAVSVCAGCFSTVARANAQTPFKASPSSSSSIAVVNATVIPMDRERAIPHQTVLIRGPEALSYAAWRVHLATIVL